MSSHVTLLKIVLCSILLFGGPKTIMASNINDPLIEAVSAGEVDGVESRLQALGEEAGPGHPLWEEAMTRNRDMFRLNMQDGQDILMDEDPQEITRWIGVVGKNLDVFDALLKSVRNSRQLERFQADRFSSAIFEGHAAVVDLLLARGYPVEVRTDAGETPLMLAAAQGNSPIMQKLLDKGASPNAGSMTETPLSLAISSGGPDAAFFLIMAGADPNGSVRHGQTPLFIVVREGNQKAFDILIAVQGIRLDAQSRFGWTPLMEAVAHGQDEMVRLLLENKVDPNQKDALGNTALMVAAREGQARSVQHLLEYKADVNTRNVDGLTPLMWAVTRPGNGEIISALIGVGADIKDKTAEGQTVASIAGSNGNEKYVPLLR